MMFVDFNEFTSNTEAVVRDVIKFVGADPRRYQHRILPPGMKVCGIPACAFGSFIEIH